MKTLFSIMVGLMILLSGAITQVAYSQTNIKITVSNNTAYKTFVGFFAAPGVVPNPFQPLTYPIRAHSNFSFPVTLSPSPGMYYTLAYGDQTHSCNVQLIWVQNNVIKFSGIGKQNVQCHVSASGMNLKMTVNEI